MNFLFCLSLFNQSFSFFFLTGHVLVHTYIGFVQCFILLNSYCIHFFIVEMSSANEAMEQEDQIKPLWRYVTKLRKTPGGGNAMIKCNLCEISFIGSYTRVRVDLLKISRKGVRPCPHVSPPKLTEFKTMDNEATLKMQNSKEKKVSLYLVKANRHKMVLLQKSQVL